MPKVFETASFERDLRLLSKSERRQLEALKDQLTESSRGGQPLRFSFLREKRIREKRVYFLVYEDAVLLVAISDKKTQQETIDKIIELLPVFRDLAERLT